MEREQMTQEEIDFIEKTLEAALTENPSDEDIREALEILESKKY